MANQKLEASIIQGSVVNSYEKIRVNPSCMKCFRGLMLYAIILVACRVAIYKRRGTQLFK